MLALLLAGVVLTTLVFAGGCAGGAGSAAGEDAAPEGNATTEAEARSEQAREPKPFEVELRPVGGSGVGGTVGFVPRDDGTEVELSLRGLPNPEGVYVGTIYRGTCAEEVGGVGRKFASRDVWQGGVGYRLVHDDHGTSPADEENVVQTLTSVASGPEGTGTSTTPLPISTDELLSDEPKYVDVHGEDARPLACADLPVGGSSGA